MSSTQEYNENGNGVSTIQGIAVPHCELCAEWPEVARVMPKSDFVGWDTPGIRKNCFDYAWVQLKKAGYTLKSPGWGTPAKINPHIYQIYATKDIGGVKIKDQKIHAFNGIKYLKQAISSGIPVMVGVDDSDKNPNTDKVTDHYVLIVGMGSDEKGNYFLFDDNATGDTDIGPSDLNRFYCDCENLILDGRPDPENPYFRDYIKRDKYRVTHIRESRPIK